VTKFHFSEFFSLLSKNHQNLSLDRNSSSEGLGHSFMLGANHSLHFFGVGFQLYSQLKKSLHNGMGVLGKSVVSMASQTTRLGKGSSVTTQDEHMS